MKYSRISSNFAAFVVNAFEYFAMVLFPYQVIAYCIAADQNLNSCWLPHLQRPVKTSILLVQLMATSILMSTGGGVVMFYLVCCVF